MSDDVEVRLADEQDAHLLWTWANDAVTRAASFSTEPIPWSDHVAWLENALSDPHTTIYIVVANGANLGQIRFAPSEDKAAEVSIALAPEWRGKGLATPSLRRACGTYAAATGCTEFVAFARRENERSIRAFTRAGFEVTCNTIVRGADATELRLVTGAS